MSPSSQVRLHTLHGLRLKGLAEAAVLSEQSAVPLAEVDAVLASAQADGLVLHRDGRMSGWMLTPDGRAAVAKLLAEEIDGSGARRAVEQAYERFLGLNAGLLGLCTDWQMVDETTLNDHTDPAHDAAVIARLGEIDEHVQPVCTDLAAALDRFAGYGTRLSTARQQVQAGHVDWFTKPTIDSYHTVWFELHEDILATLGIERSREGRG